MNLEMYEESKNLYNQLKNTIEKAKISYYTDLILNNAKKVYACCPSISKDNLLDIISKHDISTIKTNKNDLLRIADIIYPYVSMGLLKYEIIDVDVKNNNYNYLLFDNKDEFKLLLKITKGAN